MDVIGTWPTVTRTLVVSSVVLSILIHSQLIDGNNWYFNSQTIFRFPPNIPQLWRLYSTFCVTGGGIGILLDAYFLYTYSSALERNSSRFTEHGSYFVYIAFCMTFVLGTGGYILGGPFLLKALIISLAYTFSQDNPNSNVTIFILTFPAKYLPAALIFLSAVSGGWPSALVETTGLLAAHLYDFLTRIWPMFGGGQNLVPTPKFVKRWFAPEGGVREARSYGFAFRPREERPAGPWTGARGPGRRLGGE